MEIKLFGAIIYFYSYKIKYIHNSRMSALVSPIAFYGDKTLLRVVILSSLCFIL